jgi:hypothetical protein
MLLPGDHKEHLLVGASQSEVLAMMGGFGSLIAGVQVCLHVCVCVCDDFFVKTWSVSSSKGGWEWRHVAAYGVQCWALPGCSFLSPPLS